MVTSTVKRKARQQLLSAQVILRAFPVFGFLLWSSMCHVREQRSEREISKLNNAALVDGRCPLFDSSPLLVRDYELRLGGKFSAAIWSTGGVPRITKLNQNHDLTNLILYIDM